MSPLDSLPRSDSIRFGFRLGLSVRSLIKRSVIAYEPHCQRNQWFGFVLNSHAYHSLGFLCPCQHGLRHNELLGN